MPLFPASTNDDYRGSRASAVFLAVAGVATVVPGCIHAFLADGGAVTIAGLDLGASASTIVGVFAWAGATQVVHGLAMLAVALHYRSLVPLFLVLGLIERSVMTLNWWVLKPAVGHRPPEVYATLVILPLILVFLVLALRDSGGAAAEGEAGRLGEKS